MEIRYEHPGTPSSAPATPSNLSTDSPFYNLHITSSVVETQPGLSSPEALNPSSSSFPTVSDTSLYPSDETMDAVPHPQLAGRMMAAMTSAMETDQQESAKKKRGRPRKYGPGAPGSAALILAPIQSIDGCLTASPFSEKKRGRPPGSGKKQQPSSKGLHGQQATSAGGQGFTPHVITVDTGEDVASKIMSFSQIGPRAVCVLSANGAISNVTLRQPATSGGTVTYEGRFEILSLSGSFLPTEVGGTRSRTGGLSVSLAGPDGHVVGGGVAGLLMAASPVQVVLGSFIAEGQKKSVSSTSEFTQQSPGQVIKSGIKLSKVAKNDMKVITSRSPSNLPFNQGTGGGNHTTPHSPGQSMGLLQSMAWTGSEALP